MQDKGLIAPDAPVRELFPKVYTFGSGIPPEKIRAVLPCIVANTDARIVRALPVAGKAPDRLAIVEAYWKRERSVGSIMGTLWWWCVGPMAYPTPESVERRKKKKDFHFGEWTGQNPSFMNDEDVVAFGRALAYRHYFLSLRENVAAALHRHRKDLHDETLATVNQRDYFAWHWAERCAGIHRGLSYLTKGFLGTFDVGPKERSREDFYLARRLFLTIQRKIAPRFGGPPVVE